MHVLAGSKRQDSNSLYVTGYRFDAESAAQLTGLGWPRLTKLCILVDKLDTATASCLTTGSWPVLRTLQLETGGQDIAAIRTLTDHQWPSLRALKLMLGTQLLSLEFEPGVDDMAQLYCLSMSDVEADEVFMSELAAAYHARLEVLHFHSTGSAFPLPSGLVQRPWLCLTQLDVTNIILRNNDVALLVQAQLPCLLYLILRFTGLCTSTLQLLATGNWPHLEHLDLSHNCINDTAMSHLAKGTWPKLEEVRLDTNEVTPLGLACLIRASWPALLKMCVDREAVCVESLDDAARMQVPEQEYTTWVGTRCLKSQADKVYDWTVVGLQHVLPTAQDSFLRDEGLQIAIAAISLAV